MKIKISLIFILIQLPEMQGMGKINYISYICYIYTETFFSMIKKEFIKQHKVPFLKSVLETCFIWFIKSWIRLLICLSSIVCFPDHFGRISPVKLKTDMLYYMNNTFSTNHFSNICPRVFNSCNNWLQYMCFRVNFAKFSEQVV